MNQSNASVRHACSIPGTGGVERFRACSVFWSEAQEVSGFQFLVAISLKRSVRDLIKSAGLENFCGKCTSPVAKECVASYIHSFVRAGSGGITVTFSLLRDPSFFQPMPSFVALQNVSHCGRSPKSCWSGSVCKYQSSPAVSSEIGHGVPQHSELSVNQGNIILLVTQTLSKCHSCRCNRLPEHLSPWLAESVYAK